MTFDRGIVAIVAILVLLAVGLVIAGVIAWMQDRREERAMFTGVSEAPAPRPRHAAPPPAVTHEEPPPDYLPAPPQTSPAGTANAHDRPPLPLAAVSTTRPHTQDDRGSAGTRPGAPQGDTGPESEPSGVTVPAPAALAAAVTRVREAPIGTYLADLARHAAYDHSDATDSFAAVTTGWT